MDYVVALLGLAVVHLLAVASPGPSTVLVIQTAAVAGRRGGLFAALAMMAGALLLLLQLSNPKIMVFFGSIFLSLLPANLPAWMDATVLAVVAFNEFAWFALLALLFSGGPARAFYRRAKVWLDRFMGGALALLGLRLALASR